MSNWVRQDAFGSSTPTTYTSKEACEDGGHLCVFIGFEPLDKLSAQKVVVDGKEVLQAFEDPTKVQAFNKRMALEECYRNRVKEYPQLGDFADAYVKAQSGDSSEMQAYIAKCLEVKAKYPKPT